MNQPSRRHIILLSLQVASCIGLCSCRRQDEPRKLRIVVPSTLSGLFQIEGNASTVNGTSTRDGDCLVLRLPPGKRFLGLSGKSPLLEWHQIEFVDENGNRVRSIMSPSELGPSERGVTIYGITGRSQLSWFAVGTRTELLDAGELRAKMCLDGTHDLP
jgi:hypothetical protein